MAVASRGSGAAAGKRFPAGVFVHGSEPDPRFTLANERTFLAWIRTSLALIAAGVAVDAIGLPLLGAARVGVISLLLLLGVVLPIASWLNWGAAERAMRLGRPLPAAPMMPILAVGLPVVGVLVGVGMLLK